MWSLPIAILIFGTAFVAALPAKDPVLGKWSEGIRYDYLEDDAGKLHLVDNWLKASDYDRLARYNPAATNQYHLFTRQNPTLSTPLVLNLPDTVYNSFFNPQRRTVVLMHGFAGSATSEINSVLLPALLNAADLNVIVLDWSDGSLWGPRAREAGAAAGAFINWLNALTGANPRDYHLIGYSVGGHGVGIMGRNVIGQVGQVTGLDPADRWDTEWLFQPNDGVYTEVIHTNGDNIGYRDPLAQVDFYPNGGRSMPGCITNWCNHDRSFHYMAESVIPGTFIGNKCWNIQTALAGNCADGEELKMGGLEPKTGHTGIYYVKTNSRSPYSLT